MDKSCKEMKICYELVEKSPVSIIVIDLEGNIKFANKSARKKIGDIENIFEIVRDKQRGIVLNNLRKVEKDSIEFCFVDKSNRFIEVHASKIDKDLINCVLFDITNKKKVEGNLLKILKGVMDSSKDAIFVKDSDLRYIYVNRVFCEVASGKPEEEIIGKKGYDVLPSFYNDEIKEEEENILKEAKNKSCVSVESKREIKLESGENLYIHTIKTPLFDENGNVMGIVGISRDITNEKKLQDNLEEELKKHIKILLQKSKFTVIGEALVNIAHQWRQPLNSTYILLQNIKLLLEDREKLEENKDKLLEFLDRAKENIEFLTRTIDDFRNFYRVDKEKEEFSVLDEIKNVISIYEPQLKSKNVEVKINKFSNPRVLGYKNEFRQVILNLLSNAYIHLVKNKIKNPKIEITVCQLPDEVVIKVSDNAGGVDENVMDKIFEPFFTTREDGTGIGLYISKVAIEKNMGGELGVKNTEEGAEFYIKLPLSSGGKK